MHRIPSLAVLLGLLLTTQMLTSNKPVHEDAAPPLRELLAKATGALGGAERLRAVRSVSLAGTFRRVFPDQDRSGTYEVTFLSPDKYKKVESAEVSAGTRLSLTQILNQNEGWSGAGIRMSGFELNLDKLGGQPRPVSPGARRQMRGDFAVHLLAWLLASPAEQTMAQFSYAGRADAGGTQVYLLDVRGADDFAARISLDLKTYLPRSLSYRGRPPLIAIDTNNAARDAQQSHETELEVIFSDYRVEQGIVLPHHIKVESGGKLLEEFDMMTCRVNPAEITAADFERR